MPLLLFAGVGGLSLGGMLGFGVAKSINKAVLITVVLGLLWFAYKNGVFK